MSIEAREALVNSPHTIFQDDSQRTDLLSPSITKSELIALLTVLVNKGYSLEFTAVRTDHHDDSALGIHSHAYGRAADLWPLNSTTPGDYMDASTHNFRQFLVDCSDNPWLWQIGLAGSADTPLNLQRAGQTAFEDDGYDHVHLGCIV